ncbi:MAG: biotin--[acetyl-CoA-carboxylase] ligase [Elusimicrobiota bacterium]
MSEVIRLKSCRSTQDIARRMADEGALPWTLVRSDRQSCGRGRIGRRWVSGPGGLYFSLILRPRLKPADLAELSRGTAAACGRALARTTKLKIAIKLPNDVFATSARGTPFKKICGILIEASGDTRKVDWVVIGIGVNVNNRVPKSLTEASSIAALTGLRLDPETVLKAVLCALRARFSRY